MLNLNHFIMIMCRLDTSHGYTRIVQPQHILRNKSGEKLNKLIQRCESTYYLVENSSN